MTNVSKFIECMNTYQGEGPDTGKRVLLLRVKKCNRVEESSKEPCPFCDTLVKMRVSQESKITNPEIQDNINQEKVGIMLSGGEPLYDEYYYQTLGILKDLNFSFANIETNGCNLETFMQDMPRDKNIKVIYSPKFFSINELKKEITKISNLSKDLDVYFKFVITTIFKERKVKNTIKETIQKNNIHNRVYLMPEGSTKEELIWNFPDTIDLAEELKVNVSSREHLIYNFV